jgi:hypothetical protein
VNEHKREVHEVRELVTTWLVGGRLVVTLIANVCQNGSTDIQWQVGVAGVDECWVVDPATAAAIIGGRSPEGVEVLQ